MQAALLAVLLPLAAASEAAETCTEAQFTSCCANATSINILVGSPATSIHEHMADIIAEFNALNPTTPVVMHAFSYGEMIPEALADVQEGINFYAAFLVPMGQHVATFAPYLYDVSSWIVSDYEGIGWSSLGRFFRLHQALYESKAVVFPLDGDFHTLFYRTDVFAAHGRTAPRTMQEYVELSEYFNGLDLNGDGVADYGSCFSHVDYSAAYYFWTIAANYLQYAGTSQGIYFDLSRDMEPLVDNAAMHEVIELWKRVAGPPEPVDGAPRGANSTLEYWLAGRCAMTIEWAEPFVNARDYAISGNVSVALVPGSERVWNRDAQSFDDCTASLCPHATLHDDGRRVNYAPYNAFNGWSGAINKGVEHAQRLTAYRLFAFMLQPEKRMQSVLNTTAGFAPVRVDLLGDAAKPTWEAYGHEDPGLQEFLDTSLAAMEHDNAALELRITSPGDYFDSARVELEAYWRGEGSYAELSDADGAAAAAAAIAARWQNVRVEYEKMLSVYVAPSDVVAGVSLAALAAGVAVMGVVALLSLVALVLGRRARRKRHASMWKRPSLWLTVVRFVKTGHRPELSLAAELQYHVFISHMWGSAQDQAKLLYEQMAMLLPKLVAFLDVYHLDDLSQLEEHISRSAVCLSILSRGYFVSTNCMRELHEAVRLRKPMLLVHEGDEMHGGAPLAALRDECPDSCQAHLFGADKPPPVPFLRKPELMAVSLEELCRRMLCHTPKYANHKPAALTLYTKGAIPRLWHFPDDGKGRMAWGTLGLARTKVPLVYAPDIGGTVEVGDALRSGIAGLEVSDHVYQYAEGRRTVPSRIRVVGL